MIDELFKWGNFYRNWAGVGSLVELLLPTPEVRGSNYVTGKLLYGTFVYCQLHRKDENQRKKEAGNGPFKKLVEISNR